MVESAAVIFFDHPKDINKLWKWLLNTYKLEDIYTFKHLYLTKMFQLAMTLCHIMYDAIFSIIYIRWRFTNRESF